MKMFKKASLTLFTVCALMLCTGLCAANVSAAEVVDSGECGDNLTWTLYDDGELVIDGEGEMWNWENSRSVPWISLWESITSVTINEGVTSIGKNAFHSYAFDLGSHAHLSCITSVTIPESVTSIGESAFSGCEKLTSITIPSSVSTIKDYAFYSCSSITSITIPNSVVSIGEKAFSMCVSMEKITLPESLNSLGNDPFDYCLKLKSITVNKNNPDYSSDESGILFNKDKTKLICYPAGKTETSYSIPDSVYYIGNFAFDYSNLTSIYIHSGVSAITHNSLFSAEKLTCITVDENNRWYSSNEDGVLFNKDKTNLIRYPAGKTEASYTIPDSVTVIGTSSFESCSNLTSIIIPNSVISIGALAFQGCHNLTSITLPDSISEIEWGVFNCCIQLSRIIVLSRDVQFASGIGSIHSYPTFYGYAGSTTETFTTERGYKFVDLNTNSIPERDTIASGQCGDNVTWTLYIDGELIISGEGEMWNWKRSSPAPWFSYSRYITTVTIEQGITSIGGYAFYSCHYIKTVTITDSVTSINSYAFSYCDQLSTVNIGAGITSISFHECNSLKEIIVNENNPVYSNDDSGVLFNKDKTTLIHYPVGKPEDSYTIPDTVTDISNNAFENCTNLVNITIPDSVTRIGSCAFENCSSLKSIVLPASITEISSYAFEECISLSSVTVMSRNAEYFWNTFDTTSPDLTLYGYRGSTTETYASENGHVFIAFEEPEPPAPETDAPETNAPETEPDEDDTAFLLGDINLDSFVDIRDALRLFQYSMDRTTYPIEYSGNVDFTHDGNIDIKDALRLFQYSMDNNMYPLE